MPLAWDWVIKKPCFVKRKEYRAEIMSLHGGSVRLDNTEQGLEAMNLLPQAI